MSRDDSLPAPGWSALAVGLWSRRAPAAGAAECLVRGAPGRYELRVGRGPWLAAGATLLAATEHAGGHAARVELRAARGGDDLCGECATCERMRKGET